MEKRDIDFLRDLTQAPSPSGFETAAARVMRARLEGIADRIETDVLGSVHAVLKGKGKGPSVLIAGHIDEVGLMAKYISDDGFISFYAIGGVDEGILPGLRVDVHTESGPLRGIIGRMPIHLLESDQKKKATPLDKLYIDCGLSGKKAKEIIKIGDPITFSSGFEEFGDGFAVSRAFDDKLGVWIASRVLEEVKLQGGAMGDLIAAGTAQEEIGLRGGTA
ncbi:MAG: hypothetical protein LBC69_03545, partial [Eubacteriaceae bacterium]|nr:hypothetical protein [Eubacteriaceae bacterium]